MSRRRALLASLVPLTLLFGLMTAAPVAAAETFLIADMSGDQEVPGPGDDNGFGFAEIRVDPDAGTLCWFAFWDEIAEPTAAHIHAGEAGVAGPPVVTLDLPPDPDTDVCMDGLDQAVLQAVVDDPEAHYVNLHNADFPDGAIRGQVRIPPVSLFAALSGENEVPGPGDPDAMGEAFLNFEPDAGRLCVDYFLTIPDEYTAAHIHDGEDGLAGPPVITLPTDAEDGFVSGCVDGLDSALLQGILDDPAGFYVNIHTSAYPDGAARGQLSTEPPPPPPPEECVAPDICGGIMAPGTYRFDGFGLPLSFRTDNEWHSRLFVDGFGLEDPEGIGALYVISFSGLVGGGECGYAEQVDIGTGADALIEWLTNHPHLIVGDMRDVTHGGEPGVQIQLRANLPAECQEGGGYNLIFSPPFDGFYVLQGERVRFIIQEIGDETVLSIVDDFSGENMQALLSMLQTELGTTAWGEAAPGGGGGDGDDDDDDEVLPDTAVAGAEMPRASAGSIVLVVGTGVAGLAGVTLALRRRRA